MRRSTDGSKQRWLSRCVKHRKMYALTTWRYKRITKWRNFSYLFVCFPLPFFIRFSFSFAGCWALFASSLFYVLPTRSAQCVHFIFFRLFDFVFVHGLWLFRVRQLKEKLVQKCTVDGSGDAMAVTIEEEENGKKWIRCVDAHDHCCRICRRRRRSC